MAPPHQRSQRRRAQAGRPQRREAPVATHPGTGVTNEALESNMVAPPKPAVRGANTTRSTQRRTARPVEPVDYSADYRGVRQDLIRIAFWAVLLFVVMVALSYSGLV